MQAPAQVKCVIKEGEERKLPNGWRLSEDYSISKQEDYVKEMTKELLARPRPKVIPSTIQCASTQATLDRDPSKDAEHWNRHLPEGVQVEQKERPLSPAEILPFESARRSGKNALGNSDQSSVDKEKRQKGIEAFTYSKPAILTEEQRRKVTKLEEIVNTPLEPVKKKNRGWFKDKLYRMGLYGDILEPDETTD